MTRYQPRLAGEQRVIRDDDHDALEDRNTYHGSKYRRGILKGGHYLMNNSAKPGFFRKNRRR